MTFFLQFWRECCNVYYMVHLVQKKSTELVEKLFPIKYFLWKGTNGKWTQLHHSSTHHTTSKYSFLWYRNQRVMLTPNNLLKVWIWQSWKCELGLRLPTNMTYFYFSFISSVSYWCDSIKVVNVPWYSLYWLMYIQRGVGSWLSIKEMILDYSYVTCV